MANLPSIVKQWTAFIDGIGMAGKVKDLTLPVLEMTTESWRAGNMLAPIDLNMGMESLTLSATLGEYNLTVLNKWGAADASGINMRFMLGEVATDGSGTNAIEVTVRGRFKKLDLGTLEAGKLNELKLEAPLTYYKYSVNGSVIHEIDVISGKQVVDGKDITADILTAIGITA